MNFIGDSKRLFIIQAIINHQHFKILPFSPPRSSSLYNCCPIFQACLLQVLLQSIQLLLQVLCHEQLLLLRAAYHPALGVVKQDDPVELQQVAVQAVRLQQPVQCASITLNVDCN